MARPRFRIAEHHRNLVKALAGYGLKHEQIARIIGIRSPKTLRKYFRKELDIGSAEANANVAQCLYKMATSGTQPATTIFWLKSRGGWRERASEETRPVATPSLVISREGSE